LLWLCLGGLEFATCLVNRGDDPGLVAGPGRPTRLSFGKTRKLPAAFPRAPEPEDAKEQRQIMSTASAASLWRLRVAYLTWKSSLTVLNAYQERALLLVSATRRRNALSGALVSLEAQIHMLNIMAATWAAQQSFRRPFKEVELASSTEEATCAANAESMEMPASQPLKNLRHEAFAQRIAARASATAAYADAYGRPRDNVAAVRGWLLLSIGSYYGNSFQERWMLFVG
jgi:hypothetical protein